MIMITKYGSLIRAARMKQGISQAEVAKKLGLSRPSYIAIEQGKRELTIEEFEKLSGLIGISMADIKRGEVADYEKYKQMILAFLRLYKQVPKTKLAKLLYFADFGWYYTHLKSMSGMQYRKIQYGPVADAYFRLIDEMIDAGEIDMEITAEGAMLLSQTRTGKNAKLDLLSKKEENLMQRIDAKWHDKKTAEIVSFTHRQLPYLVARDNEYVSYLVFTQENPGEIF